MHFGLKTCFWWQQLQCSSRNNCIIT